MHIAILVGNYFPNYSAVGNCAKNFSEALEQAGHSVTVVSQRTLLNEAEHIEKPQHIYRIDSFILRCIIGGGNFRNLFGRTFRYMQSILQRKNVKWDIVRAYVKMLVKINQTKAIDAIVPFCFPFEGVLAATEFKQLVCPTAKVVPYLFDRFAASDALHRTNWNRRLKMSAHIALERKAFSQCDKVLTMHSWLNHIRASYPELRQKFIQVEHPLLIPIASSQSVDYDDSKLNIVYAGCLLKVIRSPLSSFNSLSNAIKDRPDICVHIYARGNCEDDILRFQRQCPDQVVYHGSVDIETAHAAMKEADILLSVGNSNITQMSSKNFEYVATGSPVIHFYCDEKDPVNDLLNKVGNCLMLSQHSTPEENGKSIVDFLASRPPRHTFEEVKEIIPEALPETTVEILVRTLNTKHADND